MRLRGAEHWHCLLCGSGKPRPVTLRYPSFCCICRDCVKNTLDSKGLPYLGEVSQGRERKGIEGR